MSLKAEIESVLRKAAVAIGDEGAYILPVGVIGYLALFGFGVYALLNAWPATDPHWILLKALYGFLTVGAPLFFFCEYVAQSEPRGNEGEAARAARLLRLKNIQDQGRTVWLACAAVVGLMFFKGT
jgi:hypothetical protein